MNDTFLRPELTELPWRVKQLPVDPRGYPIPAFVGVNQNGERDFRYMDQGHWVHCVKHRVCWVCGQQLGAYLAFAIGPMCSITRTTSEPPCHLECARWSAVNCPFLSRPHMVRREDEGTREAEKNIAGCAILRNPGVACIWVSRSFQVWRDDQGRPLITVGEPVSVEWYAEGKPATREQVLASIDSGIPLLEAQCDGPRALGALAEQRRIMETWLP